jgi:hypothetical protein
MRPAGPTLTLLNMCREFWRFTQAYGRTWQSMWSWVAVPWRFCSSDPCWFLCLNRLLCWIALIGLAILIVHIFVLIVVFFFILLVVCEILCIIFAILQAKVRCFQYADIASPPPNRAPVAQTDGPYHGLVGQSLSMSAAGSTDPDGTALTATWTFGDGQSGTGLMTSHAYANVGVFTVAVSVSDGTITAQASTTATINAIGGWQPPTTGTDTM